MKTIKRTKIIVETREILLVVGAHIRGRCPRCGGQVEIVSPEIVSPETVKAEIIEAEIVETENRAVSANPRQDASRASQPHLVEPGNEMRFTCPPSLLK